MEDIKQRLKFSDISIQSRCVQKLVQAVKKKSKGELITSSSLHIPELSLIWETCLHESNSTSNLAVRGVIHLVTNRHLELGFAVNNLLSSLSTASNVYGIVKGITRLLMFEKNQANENSKTTAYSLNRPKHPMIAVLQANEDFMPLILENIADVISEDNLRGFQVMEPVICYILSDPVHSRRHHGSKSLLIETLIEIVKKEPKTAFYILRCIPFLQVQDYHQVAEASNFILKARETFASLQCEESDRVYISELLLMSSIFLSERCVNVSHDPLRILNLALDVAHSLIQTNCSIPCINTCLVSIALILKTTSGEHIETFSNLASALLDFNNVSPTVAAFLAFSLIQLLPEPSVISFHDPASSSSPIPPLLEKAEKLFMSCESPINSEASLQDSAAASSSNEQSVRQEYDIPLEAFTFSAEACVQCAQFALKLDEGDECFKLNWLKAIRVVVNECVNEDLEAVFSLVAAIFLMSPDNPEFIKPCLETLDGILQKNIYLSTKIFALLLYKQSLLKTPESKFLILEFLPNSATHKYAIPPVLSILRLMANDANLKPQAIQLMLQLWKKHERCFPYLYKLLLENNKVVNKELGINESLVSQAAVMKDICYLSPEKHGLDLVKILSKVLNDSIDESTSPAACLALDGVINLCKCEATDLRSTWKMLGPKLLKDKRIPVICRMYKLLTLIPDLQVKSPEYDQFMADIAVNIWKRISSSSMAPEAISGAYKTLAKFPSDCHILKQLPPSARANLQLPASMKATPFEMGKLPEDVLTYTPGYCYVDLLRSLPDNCVLKGFSEFLNSIIKQEVNDLPRSVYSQRKQMQKRRNTSEALSAVPKFLCSHFEAGKTPTLRKNMAVGVLLCYEPPLEVGKDGEPIKRSLAAQSRFYEQVLSTLLNEVNIDTTDWQRCILLPSAWGAFMERAFFSCEESRRAELEMQKSLGHRHFTPEDFNLQCKCAWLWVRDRFLTVIKTSVKNAPTSHANAVFAIAGLVQASHKFQSSLDDSARSLSDDNETHTNHTSFMSEITETILCAMMPNYLPSGNVHSWLLTHLSRPNSSAGFLIQGCSCASLSHLAPVLVKSFSDKIPSLFQALLTYIPHSSPVLSFYSSLASGLLMKSLCEIGYQDSGDSQIDSLINFTKEISKFCFNEEPISSALIGLTLAVASLCALPNEECKDWISTSYNIFYEKLMEEDVNSMNFELLSISVSSMMICAVEGNCVSIDSMYTLASWFEEKQMELPQCSGTSASFGLLVDALERIKHTQGSEMKLKIQKTWFNTLTSEKKPTLHRIAALNGLGSLYSCGRGLVQFKSQENVDFSSVNDLISVMFQIMSTGKDMGLQNICSWEVGRLYSVHCFQQEAETAVPSNYSYLGPKSVLNPLLKTILPSQNANECDIAKHHVVAALNALSGEFPKPLPPLNWNIILTQLIQQHNDSSVVEAVINIALHQAKSSTYAVHFLSAYCCPPLYHTLTEDSQLFLLKNMHLLCRVLPPSKLKIFLQTVIPPILKQEKQFKKFGSIILLNIQNAVSETGLKAQTLSVFQDAFISIFRYFKKDISLLQNHLEWISEMLCRLPNKVADSLLAVARNSDDVAPLTVVVCHLIRTDKKVISSLRPYIEEGKHVLQKEKDQICAAVYKCFLSGSSIKTSEVNEPDKCISWLLETVGWMKVLSETKSQYQLMSVTEVFLFLTDICLATIIGCSGIKCSYNLLIAQPISHQLLLENLPIAITRLNEVEEWRKVTDKVIDWLLLLLRSEHLDKDDKHYVKLSLCGLRTSDEFKKLHIWTDVISSIY